MCVLIAMASKLLAMASNQRSDWTKPCEVWSSAGESAVSPSFARARPWKMPCGPVALVPLGQYEEFVTD